MSSNKIFKPRRSTGWVSVAAIAIVLLASGLYMLISYGFSGPFIFTILLTIPLGLVFLLITVFFPTMRYKIAENHLILTYGPLLHYTIDIRQIKSYTAILLAFLLFQKNERTAAKMSGVMHKEIIYYER